MTREIRAAMRRMTPEARAEALLVEKRVREETLAVKRAVSAELCALKTDEEWFAYMKRIAEKCRARGLNVS
jgi:hypothetical protein